MSAFVIDAAYSIIDNEEQREADNPNSQQGAKQVDAWTTYKDYLISRKKKKLSDCRFGNNKNWSNVVFLATVILFSQCISSFIFIFYLYDNANPFIFVYKGMKVQFGGPIPN